MPKQQPNSQTQPKKPIYLITKKFLKLVFLGNGKYWPTTLFFWIIILYYLAGFIDKYYYISPVESFYMGLPLFLSLFSILISPLFYIPGVSKFINYFGSSVEPSGDIGLNVPNPFPLFIIWLILFFLINIICIYLYKKNFKTRKNPAK